MANYINGNGIRPGHVIVHNGQLYRVLSAEHRTPGNKRAFMQVKLRNLKDSIQTEVKFRADEQVERAALEQAKMEYLYNDPSGHCFMNQETYEQVFLDDKLIGDVKAYLLPNTIVQVEFHDEKPIGVQPPETVDLTVVETEPPLKGATASGSPKPAKLETGIIVNVPQFITVGEVVRVSTTSGDYQERVKK
tara:strand:- start:3541 stop:4113 length:573 start_codon:yes stop_codon:yes gene_type:complete